MKRTKSKAKWTSLQKAIAMQQHHLDTAQQQWDAMVAKIVKNQNVMVHPDSLDEMLSDLRALHAVIHTRSRVLDELREHLPRRR